MDVSVNHFNNLLKLDNLHLIYKGIVSQNILVSIAHSIRNSSNQSYLTSKRLFAIIVELAHNIHHYSLQKEFCVKDNKYIGSGIMAVSDAADHYLIHSGNYTTKQNAIWLFNECKCINELKESDLKNYYVNRRRCGTFQDKEGGSIGLIDIKKRSNNPLESHIIEVNDDKYFFSLIVKVSKDS